MTAESLRLQSTRAGLPTLEIADAKGRWIPLHSRYRPNEEAKRWLDNLTWQGAGHIILIGLGLGYPAAAILREYGGAIRRLTVIESSPEIVELARLENPANLPWDGNVLEVLSGPEPQEVHDLFSGRLVHLLVEGLELIPAPFLEQRADPRDMQYLLELSQIKAELQRTVEHMRNQGPLIQQNLIANLPSLAHACRLSALWGKFTGTPALIIGAGPSLDGNFADLHQFASSSLFFAADTIAGRILDAGLPLHFVTAKDAHPQNLAHLERIKRPDATTLVFDPQLDPRGLEIPFAARLLSPNRCRRIHKALPSLSLQEQDALPMGQTAVHTAFSLAVHLGCNPIVLAGVDFSFLPGGGPSHASDTALQSQVDIGQGMHYWGDDARGIRDVELADLPWIPGVREKSVPTTPGFLDALRGLERLIRSSGRQVIDASEGGAKINGTSICALSEAAPKRAVADIPEPLALAREIAGNVSHSGQWRHELNDALKILEQSAAEAVSCRDVLRSYSPVDMTLLDRVRMWRQQVRAPGGSGALLEAVLEADEIIALRMDQQAAMTDTVRESYLAYIENYLTAVETYIPVYRRILEA